jgi:methylenetetrahydrofolate dehydrogenase (NADP+)/methenyltetrahydrofolate cyclohydrolase
MAEILNGTKIAKSILEENVRAQINGISAVHKPRLAIILVGNDPASEIYVNKKISVCKEYNINPTLLKFDDNVEEEELVQTIHRLNLDPLTFGILIQLPLPLKFSKEVLSAINPIKDVDCLTPRNIGLVMQGRPYVLPCAVKAILEVFLRYKINMKGKHVVVLNRNFFIGQALASLLSQDNEVGNATVTICHEHTLNLQNICKSADVIISAVGKRDKFVLNDKYVNNGSIVIDIGVSRFDKKIIGDVDLESIDKLAQLVTPPIGGIGPMTIACLLSNFVLVARHQLEKLRKDRKREYNKYAAKAKRGKLKTVGKCQKCGENLDRKGTFCSLCCEQNNDYWNDKKKKKLEMGECFTCSNKALTAQTRCEVCYLKCLAYRCLDDRSKWEQLKDLFEKQNICPYSGVQLQLGINSSIDHKISIEKGGINMIENLQWVYTPVNTMKWDFTEDEFLNLIKLIYGHRNRSGEVTKC